MSDDAIVPFTKHTEGWYQTILKIRNSDHLEQVFDFIGSSLQGSHKHVEWRFTENNDMAIRFRYSRDYEWFLLRWS